MNEKMGVVRKLAELICDKFKSNPSYAEMESFIMNYFDEVTTVYGTYKIFSDMQSELEKYYSAKEKECDKDV